MLVVSDLVSTRVLHPHAELNNVQTISRDRFSVTPTAIYDELVAPPQIKKYLIRSAPLSMFCYPHRLVANPALVKVRNAQKLQSLWNEDATRRQARMRSPLDEDEEVVQTQGSDEQVDVAENAAETVPRVLGKYLDIDSEFRSGTGKFKNWQDVVKIANEVHLDEMKALLETGPQFLLMRSIDVAGSPCVAWHRRCV